MALTPIKPKKAAKKPSKTSRAALYPMPGKKMPKDPIGDTRNPFVLSPGGF